MMAGNGMMEGKCHDVREWHDGMSDVVHEPARLSPVFTKQC